MNTYLITTTSGDEWEMSGGVFIVVEENKKAALKLFEEKIIKTNSTEKVVKCELIKSSKKGILFAKFSVVQ